MERRIVFHAFMRGLGHVSRLTAIANELMKADKEIQPLLLTDGAASSLPWPIDFPVFSLPGLDALVGSRWLRWGPSPVWSLVRHVLAGLIDGFRPHLLVHDTVIWDPLRLACGGRPVGQALVLRQRRDLDSYFTRYASRLASLNLILLVGEAAGDATAGWVGMPARVRQIAPIVRHDREALRPDESRRRYSVAEHENLVVITVGGGDFGEAGDVLQAALDAAAACREQLGSHRVIAVAGPLSDSGATRRGGSEAGQCDHVTVVRSDTQLSDLFAAARIVVCEGGYNTLLEVADVGVPAVCIPSPRPFDDQYARAMAMARAGYHVFLAQPTVTSIADHVSSVLQRPLAPFVPGPTRFTGAREAAHALLDVLGDVSDTAWHREVSSGLPTGPENRVKLLDNSKKLVELAYTW